MKMLLALVTAAAAVPLFASPEIAHADATCTSLVATVKSHLAAGKFVNVMLSQHRQDANWGVQYSEGFLGGRGAMSYGGATEYFSIRRNASQIPFSGDAENLSWSLDQNGVLRIHNQSWNFDFAPIDFTCKGGMMTAYQPGSGVFTLTFGDYFDPIS
jgi:hypothetical protein